MKALPDAVTVCECEPSVIVRVSPLATFPVSGCTGSDEIGPPVLRVDVSVALVGVRHCPTGEGDDELDPSPDPMTKEMHQAFTRRDFSPEELVFIAATAGIDPNLLCIAHVLATPEFRLAQMLRKMSFGEEYRAGPLEVGVLREMFGLSAPDGCHQEARSLLTSLALRLFPQDWWVSQLNGE